MKLLNKLKRALGLGKQRIDWHLDRKGVLHIHHDVIVHGHLIRDGDRNVRVNIKMPQRQAGQTRPVSTRKPSADGQIHG